MQKLARVALVLGFIVVVCGIAPDAAPRAESPAQPPLRQIPGLTAPDRFPHGCVDCHVNRPDTKMDVRISTLMRQWQEGVDLTLLERVRRFTPAEMPLKGKHPKVNVAGAEIPKACLKCHTQTSKFAPPFARLLHGLHLVGAEKNHFVSLFEGECTHCHKLDPATGVWSLGSGTEK